MSKVVRIEADALHICIAHALSTEREEVMGLLIGQTEETVVHIHASVLLRRIDKRKDRVEISPEQLSNASSDAERMGLLTREQKPMRIVGWYHSHPHITVWPSHVDLRTQAMYQIMDESFVGLIVSCFDDVNVTCGDLQVTCFQSNEITLNGNAAFNRVDIPIEIRQCKTTSKASAESLMSLPKILYEEEKDSYLKTLDNVDQDLITAIQNGTEFTRSVMSTIEVTCSPLLKSMEMRLKENARKLERLQQESLHLERLLSNG